MLPGVEIVARQDGKASRTDSMTVMENILTANPDVDIVYGINFDTGAGAWPPFRPRARIASSSAPAGLPRALRCSRADDPNLKVMCANVPVVQAEDTIDAITAIFNGEELPEETISMPTLLDAETIHGL